ncbi:MAG TPA: DUF3710 domain-containing protein [Pseudonocardiaceae bacterium]|nr:DUF3710 domain-containing protein [Pseudonocardiaceae bacterium]
MPDGVPEDVADGGPASGPYDVDEAPDDGWIRLDLGSLRLPVPEGAQLQVEVDSSGPVRAVHLMTGLGRFTVTAYAAPRSGGLWREVAPELVSWLHANEARVGRVAGEWGEEIEAVTEQGVLRFLAVDGPRWMLRGVAVGTAEHVDARIALLRDVIRQTVVVRGLEPLPVRSPLPLQLPGPLGEQLKQATAELVNAAADGGGDTTQRG